MHNVTECITKTKTLMGIQLSLPHWNATEK